MSLLFVIWLKPVTLIFESIHLVLEKREKNKNKKAGQEEKCFARMDKRLVDTLTITREREKGISHNVWLHDFYGDVVLETLLSWREILSDTQSGVMHQWLHTFDLLGRWRYCPVAHLFNVSLHDNHDPVTSIITPWFTNYDNHFDSYLSIDSVFNQITFKSRKCVTIHSWLV